MRIIETDCTVEYDGRGSTYRGRGVRLLIIKDDGSFLVHRSTGVKPLNYMTKVVSIDDGTDGEGNRELVVRSKSETIIVTMYDVIFDMDLPSVPKDTSKSVESGTEAQLQAWLAQPDHWRDVMGDRLFISREVDVGNGAVDLMGITADGSRLVVIEMKRHSRHNDVFQVERYREALQSIANDEDAFMAFASSLASSAGSTVTGGLLRGMDRTALLNPDCWLVASDADSDVDEFAAQHDIKSVTVGRQWVQESVPADVARKAHSSGCGDSGHGLIPFMLP